MIVVLSLGAVGALVGCRSGIRRHEQWQGTDLNEAAGCLFGVLNAGVFFFLVYLIYTVIRTFE